MTFTVQSREMVIRTDWHCTEPNPEEEVLKEEFRSKLEVRDKYFKEEMAIEPQREREMFTLLRAAGLNSEELPAIVAESKEASRKSLEEALPVLLNPVFDFEPVYAKELKAVKANARELAAKETKAMSGFLFDPVYGGSWKSWNGESEEIPHATIDTAGRRIDLRTQAFGEGWWDGDYSEVHGYLAYRLTPPTWGQLHVYAYPWLHGYHSLYADDTWYKSEKAEAKVSTWIDLHQYYWRTRSHVTRFHMGGYELHPTRYGRMDKQYGQQFSTPVGAGDPVTIRVGVRLYGYGKASGGRSTLDFHDGNGNYVHLPYIYWRLDQ